MNKTDGPLSATADTVGDVTPAIEAIDLVKRFGGTAVDKPAVDGVSFAVPPGTVLGLLGPNGAGKTTTVRMMTTLTEPTSGTARVAGYDVRREPDKVRRSMGLTGQVATVDELLTGRENMRMVGGLYGIRRKELARLGDQLLEQFSSRTPPTGWSSTYSGGMRRRLDLAVSLLPRHRCCSSTSRPPGSIPQPQRLVGGAARFGRARHHAVADHAVPGGGRPARRQHRGDRPGPHHRRGHPAAAQAAGGQRQPGVTVANADDLACRARPVRQDGRRGARRRGARQLTARRRRHRRH